MLEPARDGGSGNGSARPTGLAAAVESDHAGLAEELRNLRAQLAARDAQLQQAGRLAELGQLAANFAHEISNPLACVFSNVMVMQDYVDKLLTTTACCEQAEWISPPSDGAARMVAMRSAAQLAMLRRDIPALLAETRAGIDNVRAMLRNVQDFARADSGHCWQWADLNATVAATLNVAAGTLRRHADVVCDLGELPPLHCLPSQLGQLVLNLLVNATHACGQERGQITVRTGTGDGQVWLSVSDTGCGIAREHLDSIFEPYFTTKPAGAGTGLGLALVRTIVERHHGSIDVDSEPGLGSSFRISLPIASAGHGDSAAGDR